MKILLLILAVAARVLTALATIGVALFCTYGFLESFELPSPDRLPWQARYGALGLLCLALANFVVRRRQTKA